MEKGWFKVGCFWGYFTGTKAQDLCVESPSGLFVMQPKGKTLRLHFIFKGTIGQFKRKYEKAKP